MDIVRRRSIKKLSVSKVLKPFKDGTKQLAPGFKYIGDGFIEHLETKTKFHKDDL